MPELNDVATPPVPAGTDLLQASMGRDDLLVRISDIVAELQAQEPGLLSSVLPEGSFRADLHAVLSQLDPGRSLPILLGLATANVVNRRELLDALLDAGPPGSAETVRAMLQAAHRKELLAEIFNPDRVHGLRRACRTLAKEPT